MSIKCHAGCKAELWQRSPGPSVLSRSQRQKAGELDGGPVRRISEVGLTEQCAWHARCSVMLGAGGDEVLGRMHGGDSFWS